MKRKFFILFLTVLLGVSTPALAKILIIFKDASSIEVESVRYEKDKCIYINKGAIKSVSLDLIEEIYVLNEERIYGPDDVGPDANPHPPEKKTTLIQKLLNLFQKKPKNRTSPTVKPYTTRTSPTVELYTTSWCPYCDRARDFFRSRGIPFKEYDIEKDKSAAARKNRLDTRGGVPFVLINGRGLHGYSAAAYERALKEYQ